MTREELLISKEYCLSKFQIDLYRELAAFKKKKHMNYKELADYLGCTEDYVLQISAGDFNDTISKYIEICLAIGKIPDIELKDFE